MPQKGVTLADVEAAVQALRAAAQPVTARSVRRALGDRGSLTTLAAHLRSVRKQEAEQNAEDEARPRLALPDALAEGLVRGAERHWAELNDAAQAIVAQAQAQAQERVTAAYEAEDKAREAEKGARAAEARTAQTLVETVHTLEALRGDHATLVEEHRQLGVALRLAEERGRGAEALAAERKEALEQGEARLAWTQGELVEVRQTLERHRAEAIARERELTARTTEAQNACRIAEEATEEIRTRLGRVEPALERARAEREEAILTLEETQKVLDAERQAHLRTEKELVSLRERCEALGRALERSERHGETIAAALRRVEERAGRAQAALEAGVRAAARRGADAPGISSVD